MSALGCEVPTRGAQRSSAKVTKTLKTVWTAAALVVPVGVVAEMLEVGHQGNDTEQTADDTEGQKWKRDHPLSIRALPAKRNTLDAIFRKSFPHTDHLLPQKNKAAQNWSVPISWAPAKTLGKPLVDQM
jgi:hypothetical protein